MAVSKWKSKGLLVLDDDGSVNVEASNKKIDARPHVYRGGETTKKVKPGNRKGSPETRQKSPPEPVPSDDLSATASRLLATGARAMLPHAEAVRNKENYLALLKELEYDRDSGAVVEVAEVAKQVAAEYAIVRAKLIGIPARVAGRVAVMKSPEEVKALLDEEISEALAGLTIDAAHQGHGQAL